jgi:hypothetical protein
MLSPPGTPARYDRHCSKSRTTFRGSSGASSCGAKTGTAIDEDLRQLWMHEMRQVQRVMSYAGAHEVIVDVLDFIEDDDDFAVVLERVGASADRKAQACLPAPLA